MAGPAGPSSFEMMQRQGPAAGGHGGSGMGISKCLFGIDSEQKLFMNLNGMDDQMLQVTGFSNIKGVGEMLATMRGEGFFGKIWDEIFSNLHEAFNDMHDMSNLNSGNSSGDSSATAGSNRPFSSMPAMDTVGPASDVPWRMMGGLTPDHTPNVGRGGMGMGAGMGGAGYGV